jgi:hypothetical protein
MKNSSHQSFDDNGTELISKYVAELNLDYKIKERALELYG